MCSLMRRLFIASAKRQSGFLLNSSNARRAIDEVSTRSNHFEHSLQVTRSRPAGNLSSDLPQPRPEISTESNRSESFFRLTNSVHSTRLALELDGRAALPTYNFNEGRTRQID